MAPTCRDGGWISLRGAARAGSASGSPVGVDRGAGRLSGLSLSCRLLMSAPAASASLARPRRGGSHYSCCVWENAQGACTNVHVGLEASTRMSVSCGHLSLWRLSASLKDRNQALLRRWRPRRRRGSEENDVTGTDTTDAVGREASAADPGGLMRAYEAASMYYVQGETMEVIAHHLRVSRSTVSRLLARARQEGVVRVTLVQPGGAGSLEGRMTQAFGVRTHIVPVREGTTPATADRRSRTRQAQVARARSRAGAAEVSSSASPGAPPCPRSAPPCPRARSRG